MLACLRNSRDFWQPALWEIRMRRMAILQQALLYFFQGSELWQRRTGST